MKKFIIISIVMLFLTGCSNDTDQLSNDLLKEPVKKITIEDLSEPITIEISDEHEINNTIKALKLGQWKKIKKWNLALAPNLFVVINNELIIGLFKGDHYARLDGGRDGYYEIPKNIDKQIMKVLDRNK